MEMGWNSAVQTRQNLFRAEMIDLKTSGILIRHLSPVLILQKPPARSNPKRNWSIKTSLPSVDNLKFLPIHSTAGNPYSYIGTDLEVNIVRTRHKFVLK